MLTVSVFYKWDAMSLAGSSLLSAGLLIILLAVVAGIGAYLAQPWAARVAGAAMTVLLGLLVVRFLGESDPDVGLLLAFAGGVLTLVGSFLPQRVSEVRPRPR